MECPKCDRVFESGVATIVAFSRGTADTCEDALVHSVAALRTFPRLRHTGACCAQMLKVCGHIT
jgi:hypothetical protein